MAEFRILQKGTDNSDANSLISFGGMSPGGQDLFVFIRWKISFTLQGRITGMLDISNSGTIISSFFKGSYSWLILENLSAISSACSWSELIAVHCY